MNDLFEYFLKSGEKRTLSIKIIDAVAIYWKEILYNSEGGTVFKTMYIRSIKRYILHMSGGAQYSKDHGWPIKPTAST